MPKVSPVERAIKDGIVRQDAIRGFECVVCRSALSGEQSVVQHLEGSKHREAATKYAIAHFKTGPQSLVALLLPKTREAAKKGIIFVDINGTKCTICSNTLTGVQQIEDHLAGDEHKKKTDAQRLASITGTLPKPPALTAKVPVAPPVRVPQPSGDHLMDKNVIEKKMKMGIISLTDDKTHPYICITCNKSFNSPATLLDHLRSKKHQKMEQDNRKEPPPPAVSCETGITPWSLSPIGERVLQYSVLSNPRGYVYVFNYTFPLQGSRQRSGADNDSRNLNETFSQMGYEVFIHKDLTGRETNEELNRITRNPNLNGIDSLIICILSHGKDAYTFYANDTEELDLFRIRQMFTDRKCPYMRGKPKIFFTNYCRGDQMERKALDSLEVPNDVVTIHAATEGIMARRSPDFGTHFVRSLCDVLKQFGRNTDLRDIYTHLEYAMKEKNGTKPMWEDYGFRKFNFNPC